MIRPIENMRSCPFPMFCGFVLCCVALLCAGAASAQVPIAGPVAVVQDFDAIGSASAAALPDAWWMSAAGSVSPAWGDAGLFPSTSAAASSGSPTSGGRYNWGNGGNATDRAVGFMTSGSYNSPNSVLACFRNDTGSVIRGLAVSYDIERYRINTAPASVGFSVSTDGVTWVSVPAGDTGAFSTGSSSYTFAGGTVVEKDVEVGGLQLAVGALVYLRWNFVTTGANSQGLGLDNVSVMPLFASASAPVITSFTPASGAPGTNVEITGERLSGATAVRFGGVDAASFTVWSDVRIDCTVPVGCGSGPITVVTPAGMAESAAPFTPVSPLPVVVVNKYLNSTVDWVELLVVGDQVPGHHVDMRGMILKDFTGDMANDGGGKYQLSNDAVWSQVPVGTLIAIADDTRATDADASDHSLLLGLQNTTYFNKLGTGTFEIATTDLILIKRAGSSAAGTDGAIHALAGGQAGPQFDGIPSPKLIAKETSGTGKAVAANNSTSTVADYGGTDASGNLAILPASFGSANNPANLVFIRRLRGVLDGDGLATVVNSTPQSPLASSSVFLRDQPNQSAELTLVATSPATVISTVRVTLPSCFSPPQSQNLVLEGDGAATAVASVVGSSIHISGAAVTQDHALVLRISGLVPAGSVHPENTGIAGFQVETAVDGGVPTAIATQPEVRVTIPISCLRDVDSSGRPADSNRIVAIDGVCTMASFIANGTSGFLQDESAGINVFSASSLGLQRAGRFVILGRINSYNGLTEIEPLSAAGAIHLGPSPEPVAIPVALADLLANPENWEGRLVRVSGLSKVSGLWKSGSTVLLQDSNLDAIQVSLRPNSTATAEPVYPAEITGILSQNDTSAPYDGNYQILPRDASDVTGAMLTNYTGWSVVVDNQEADRDYDGDGIPNGVEYFMGTEADRHTVSPQVVDGSVVWPRSATASVASWRVEVSSDLIHWEDCKVRYDAYLDTSSPDRVRFYLPNVQGGLFVRFAVDP